MLKNLSDYIKDALLLGDLLGAFFIQMWGHMQMMLQMDENLHIEFFENMSK